MDRVREEYQKEFHYDFNNPPIDWKDEEDIKRQLRFWTRSDIRDPNDIEVTIHSSNTCHIILHLASDYDHELEEYYISLLMSLEEPKRWLIERDVKLAIEFGHLVNF